MWGHIKLQTQGCLLQVQALQEEEADNDLDDDPEETKAEIVAAVGTATLQVMLTIIWVP